MKIHLAIAALSAALVSTGSLSAQDESGKPGRRDRGERPQRGEQAGKIFERIDTDNSGAIDLEELKAASELRAEKAFGNMDKDGDGSVTREEFHRPRFHGGRGGKSGAPEERAQE